jgi:hypothetical protein
MPRSLGVLKGLEIQAEFMEITIGSPFPLLVELVSEPPNFGLFRSRIDDCGGPGIGGASSSTEMRGDPVFADVAYVVTLKREAG